MKIIPSLISFITFLLLLSCSEGKNYNAEIKGNTMGTYYIINIVDIPPRLNLEFIEKEIKKTLLQANSILSNWDEKSEISLLNNNQRIGAITNNRIDTLVTKGRQARFLGQSTNHRIGINFPIARMQYPRRAATNGQGAWLCNRVGQADIINLKRPQ